MIGGYKKLNELFHNDDFPLTYNSPCKDKGDNTVVNEQYDFEGDPPLQHMWGWFHLLPPFITIPLVLIPSNGILILRAAIPSTPPAPHDVFIQA